jgi:DNA-binding response OmpR family regulator
MLPELNGYEVCKEIRKKDLSVPIIFLSALGTAENIVMGLEHRGDDYIVKPFKFIELLARIRNLLRRRKDRGLGHLSFANKSLKNPLRAGQKLLLQLMILGDNLKPDSSVALRGMIEACIERQIWVPRRSFLEAS